MNGGIALMIQLWIDERSPALVNHLSKRCAKARKNYKFTRNQRFLGLPTRGNRIVGHRSWRELAR